MKKLITCEHCKAEHNLEDILQEREVRTGLLEVGLLCTCGVWTHSYFTNEEMKAKVLRNTELLQKWQSSQEPAIWIKYETARDAYKNQFAAFNRRWRRKFGMIG